MGNTRRSLVVVAALVLALSALSGTATGSDDPFNGSWNGVFEQTGAEIHVTIGGGNHHVVVQAVKTDACGPGGKALMSGFAEVDDGELTMTAPLYCLIPRVGRVLTFPAFPFELFDNGDGTLTDGLNCFWPTGHPEACA